jgi:hypothetical protein
MAKSSDQVVSVDTQRRLAESIAQFRYDPLGFVMFAFPWGQPGTSLARKSGPEPWQRDLLIALGNHMIENAHRRELEIDMEVWRSAVASGHGVGKSALVAWLIIFMMSTRVNCRGVVTANTAQQLETKTWPELSKWHYLSITRSWFTWTASSYYFAEYDEDRRKNYMVSALTVSQENTEAFAGLHNEDSAVFIIKDEASGIPEKIYEVADGAMTDGEAFSFDFGNPTRPEGPFFDAFTKHADIYSHLAHVDSREVSHTNKAAINDIIRKYGIDSDVVKYRVLGRFPTKSYDGFISGEQVTAAQERDHYGDPGAALILGIDVARYGNDDTVFCFRRGRDARSIPMHSFNGLSTTQVADRAIELIQRYKPDATIIEGAGPGVGVIDQLKARGFRIIEVYPGAGAEKFQIYQNKRAEWWQRMKTWIDEVGCLPPDIELAEQLTTIHYKLNEKSNKQQMEGKREMESRGLKSPDKADALALTFATPVARADRRNPTMATTRPTAVIDNDPLAMA